MYLYLLKDGEFDDREDCIIVSTKLFTQDEFNDLFLKCKSKNKIFNIWCFANYLIDSFNFFWPNIQAEIDFKNPIKE
jgi:hypothetical protein